MPPKKNNYRNRNAKKTGRGGKARRHIPSRAGKTSKSVLAFMKNQVVITKKHLHLGLDGIRPFGSDDNDNGVINNATFKVLLPLNLTRTIQNGPADDWGNRESSKIFAKNTRFNMKVRPDPLFLEPFYIRILCGYFKGDDNAGTQAITEASLKSLYPHVDTGIYTKHTGQRDFYWKYQKTRLCCPKQIYDSNGSDDADPIPGIPLVGEPMKALVCPFNMSYNFVYNSIKEYESNDGDSLQGWTPVIAIQCMPLEGNSPFQRRTLEGDLTKPGTRPGPVLDIVATTYFNDCH